MTKRQVTLRDKKGVEYITWEYVPTSHSTYHDIRLTDKFVFENASIMTQGEMSDLFGLNKNTFHAHFSEVHAQGKAHHRLKRRHALELAIEQLSPSEATFDADGNVIDVGYNHAHKDAKTNEYKNLMELWMKRYDKLGKEDPDAEDTIQSNTPEWVVIPPTFEQPTELTASEKAELEGSADD